MSHPIEDLKTELQKLWPDAVIQKWTPLHEDGCHHLDVNCQGKTLAIQFLDDTFRLSDCDGQSYGMGADFASESSSEIIDKIKEALSGIDIRHPLNKD